MIHTFISSIQVLYNAIINSTKKKKKTWNNPNYISKESLNFVLNVEIYYILILTFVKSHQLPLDTKIKMSDT